MVTAVLSIVGFLVGIIYYGQRGGEVADLSMPIICLVAGAIVGGIIDVISNAVKGKKNKRNLYIVFFILTSICLGFTLYTFIVNADAVLEPLRQIAEGRILYGLINMILFPFVVFIGYFAKFADFGVSLVIGYGFALLYAVVLSLMFGHSNLISTSDEHQGKYMVTVNMRTGEEVGERVPLDSYTEALKENAKIILLIIAGTLFSPFLSYAIGYSLCFWRQLEKKHVGVTIALIGILTVLPYVILFIFGK